MQSKFSKNLSITQSTENRLTNKSCFTSVFDEGLSTPAMPMESVRHV